MYVWIAKVWFGDSGASLANEDFEATKQVKPSFSSQNRLIVVALFVGHTGVVVGHTRVFEGSF